MGSELLGLGVAITVLIHYAERPSPLGRQPPLFIGLNQVLSLSDLRLFWEGLHHAVIQLNPIKIAGKSK